MSKRITVREQRTMFQPCSLCGAPILFGSTLLGVPRHQRIAAGIFIAQTRRRAKCSCCLGRIGTIAESIRDFSITRPVRLRGAA